MKEIKDYTGIILNRKLDEPQLDLPIGTKLKFNNQTLKVTLDKIGECANCYFKDYYKCNNLACSRSERKNEKDVIFKKIK